MLANGGEGGYLRRTHRSLAPRERDDLSDLVRASPWLRAVPTQIVFHRAIATRFHRQLEEVFRGVMGSRSVLEGVLYMLDRSVFIYIGFWSVY